ncbi:MAG: ATP-dependent RNA helicase DbpA [Pseudomonadales bacterium]
MLSFDCLGLPKAQIKNLNDLGYTAMTEVQAAALPGALAGRDLLVQAKTGSGKTAAFGLPLLGLLNPKDFGVQALVLCPTRELASQVAAEIRRLARFQANIKVVVLCGGQPIGPQIGSLEHGAHVIVGTPGRLKDHLRKKTLRLSRLKVLVLDEADRMLDMGFSEDLDDIVRQTPKDRQTLLFSATFPDDIVSISGNYQRQPTRVSVSAQVAAGQIEQRVYEVNHKQKFEALLGLLQSEQPGAAVIFCQTKERVRGLEQKLRESGVFALALHGDLEQRERDQVLIQFKQQSCRLLIATDVAARGLDIDALPMVINFDIPLDADVYVHRIGRTGRAEATGVAVTLMTPRERHRLEAIESRVETDLTVLLSPRFESNVALLPPPEYSTIELSMGRKDKIRPGDVLGAVTGSMGFSGAVVGRIEVAQRATFVAIARDQVKAVLAAFSTGKVKGRAVKVRRLS